MIIADTGFWIALFNRRDAYHTLTKQCLPLLMEPLVTTLPVITETCYLLQQQVGVTYAVAFLREYIVPLIIIPTLLMTKLLLVFINHGLSIDLVLKMFYLNWRHYS